MSTLIFHEILKQTVWCELSFYSDPDKKFFDQVYEQKDIVEAKLNAHLDWERLEGKNASRIIQYKDFDLADRENWEDIFEWLYERSAKFCEVFSPIVQRLE